MSPDVTPPEPYEPPGPAHDEALDDAPPILGSWARVYGVVFGTLVTLVIIFQAITAAYG